MRELFAHSPNEHGIWHSLENHLRSVATLAAQFCEKFDAGHVGYALGITHDLGKASEGFQQYLASCAKNELARSVPHAAPGAAAAKKELKNLALAVLGHHSGLPNPDKAKNDIQNADETSVRQARKLAERLGIPHVDEASLPPLEQKTTCEMFLRMCFSALIDADRLNTELHFSESKHSLRSNYPSIPELAQTLDSYMRKFSKSASFSDSLINKVRAEILRNCLSAASNPRGAFRLTAPTGCGKTLASLTFALKHAETHKMDRVIVAIPYTSIIDQTAEVYAEIFGPDNILEHHSAFEADEDEESQNVNEIRRRLAAENWDCPLVVTTNVQLFESLFSNRPSRCRKLHNISKSVIVLDEVQTLPVGMLLPILDCLKELICRYGCSIVFCTATQPDYSGIADSLLSRASEIVCESNQYFDALKRVSFEVLNELTTIDLARQIDAKPQVLCVLNSRADAVNVARACRPGDDLFHLSTLMCPKHRKDRLREIRTRLENEEPVRLISTQVVEAGVDLDFPFVMRAMGPLDRIIQVAGRCNREGKMKRNGTCVLFKLAGGGSPGGDYRTAAAVTETIIEEAPTDFDRSTMISRFFREYFNYAGVEAGKGKLIQQKRERFHYQDVEEMFRLIPNNTVSVVAMNYDRVYTEGLLGQAANIPPRLLFRKLMPVTVTVRKDEFDKFVRAGLVRQHEAGPWLFEGEYDDLVGIGSGQEPDPADLII